MTGKLSRKYQLIPAMDPNEPPLSPAAFFPAIPVQLGKVDQQTLYATIDVSLQLSKISTTLLEELNIPMKGQEPQRSTKGSDIIAITVTVLEPNLFPWLRFRDVPFRVITDSQTSEPLSRLVLGYKGFLSNLRLTLDFPRMTLTINSKKRFIISEGPPRTPQMPSSIVQGEQLISTGSYSSAVALIASGLEQSLLSDVEPSSSIVNPNALGERVLSITGDENLTLQTKYIYQLRNRAVHGKYEDQITESEARTVLSSAKKIIRKINPPA